MLLPGADLNYRSKCSPGERENRLKKRSDLMSLYCAVGSEHSDLSPEQLNHLLVESLSRLGQCSSVLAIPPDITRLHSQAGLLTRLVWQHYRDHLTAVLPALGTHAPMRPDQLARMFGDMPHELFRV